MFYQILLSKAWGKNILFINEKILSGCIKYKLDFPKYLYFDIFSLIKEIFFSKRLIGDKTNFYKKINFLIYNSMGLHYIYIYTYVRSYVYMLEKILFFNYFSSLDSRVWIYLWKRNRKIYFYRSRARRMYLKSKSK